MAAGQMRKTGKVGRLGAGTGARRGCGGGGGKVDGWLDTDRQLGD